MSTPAPSKPVAALATPKQSPYATITSVADLGVAVRAARKAKGLQLEAFAQLAGVSKQFAADVEHGKPTVQLERVLRLCSLLGISLGVSLPTHATAHLQAVQKQGVKPHRPRGRQQPAERRHVLGQWYRKEGGEFQAHPASFKVPARITARTVLVELPDGRRHSLRRFDATGTERTQWRLDIPAPDSPHEAYLVITL